ncbi:MAG: MarR family transcriptional regulator [Bacteroidetes bacterium 43-16]|nr:MAG: MarR family transcriptional regulator [Bacteroidetes bacterium 43-16]
MKYNLLKDVIQLIEDFERFQEVNGSLNADIEGLKQWISNNYTEIIPKPDPEWEGKEKGRTAESIINTLIVHMNRYAKTYSRSAIYGSDFSTQEEFIYLIVLKAFGEMTKMELIKQNIQDKPTGMQIISRLLKQGWIVQEVSETDRRSKMLQITDKGLETLEKQMDKIRQATNIVTGDLTHPEKMELIRLLTKLDRFHKPIFSENIPQEKLLERAKMNI